MPLNCDCYDGCWGDHSENWPRVIVPTGAFILLKGKPGTLQRQTVSEALFAAAVKLLPHGTYVWGGRADKDDLLRVEKPEYVDVILKEVMI